MVWVSACLLRTGVTMTRPISLTLHHLQTFLVAFSFHFCVHDLHIYSEWIPACVSSGLVGRGGKGGQRSPPDTLTYRDTVGQVERWWCQWNAEEHDVRTFWCYGCPLLPISVSKISSKYLHIVFQHPDWNKDQTDQWWSSTAGLDGLVNESEYPETALVAQMVQICLLSSRRKWAGVGREPADGRHVWEMFLCFVSFREWRDRMDWEDREDIQETQ